MQSVSSFAANPILSFICHLRDASKSGVSWGGDNGGCVTWGGGDGVSATGRAVNWDCVTSNWHRCPVYLDAHVQRNLLLLTSHTSLQVPPCWQGVVAQQWLLQNRSEQSCWGLSYGKCIKNGTLLKRASKYGMGPWVWNYDLTERTINSCDIVESLKTQLKIIQNFIKDHLCNFDSSYKFSLIEIKKKGNLFFNYLLDIFIS